MRLPPKQDGLLRHEQLPFNLDVQRATAIGALSGENPSRLLV